MEEEASADYQPNWSVKLVLCTIIFGGWGCLAEEMVFNHHDKSDICERAAANPLQAFRDVLRECRLDEWGKQIPLTPAEERALREEMEAE